MKKPVDIRVDFYADGSVIPIALAIDNGTLTRIDRVIQIKYDTLADITKYKCRTKDKECTILQMQNRWYELVDE